MDFFKGERYFDINAIESELWVGWGGVVCLVLVSLGGWFKELLLGHGRCIVTNFDSEGLPKAIQNHYSSCTR